MFYPSSRKHLRSGLIVTLSAAVVVTLGYLLFCPNAQAAVLDPGLEAELASRSPGDEIAVIVSLSDRVDHRLFRTQDRSRRDTRLARVLKAKAAATQGAHRAFLRDNGGRRLRELWLIHGMAVTAPVSVIRQLATRPGIESIRPDSVLQAPATGLGGGAPPEWNLNLMHAPELWSLGHTGTGMVVANMDTGVDGRHPDLATRWRGGGNSWYDPHGEHAAPHDSDGHGTQTMAIMVGGDAGGTAIGMAPGAQWIAVKLYNDAGVASFSDIHLAFQWLLDPDGDADTLDAPDVVNASWGLVGTAGQCNTEFSEDIEALRTAGIAVAFAAGNDGPSPLTSLSPANDPQSLSIGAVDASLVVAGTSGRGASACDGGIYPKLVTPGVDINTADLSFGGMPLYVVVSGTSYAAPHAAGALALLAGAFPGANVARLEDALIRSSGDLGVAGADNSYGHGLVDVQAAYEYLLAGEGGGSPPAITSTPPTSAVPGSPYGYPVMASDPDGDALTYSFDAAPAGMTINVSTGEIAWTPGMDQAGAHGVGVRVTDAHGQSATQSFNVMVAKPNQAPVAANNFFSISSGRVLRIAAPGILGNDTDGNADGLNAALVSGTAHGSLALNGDGSFSYTPNAGFAGADRFVYRAHDGELYSDSATVSIKVKARANQAPVARMDTVTASRRTGPRFTPRLIDVLGNDFDRDGSLDPRSVTIVADPDMGGRVVVSGGGRVIYTPRLRFTGSESFMYTVRDMGGEASRAARVTVIVR